MHNFRMYISYYQVFHIIHLFQQKFNQQQIIKIESFNLFVLKTKSFNNHLSIIIQLYMSSLAAARADGYYRPKNFDPQKFAPRKSDKPEEKPFTVVQGERVGGFKTRYQTPFHVRCEGCQNMVAKGVRFNSIQTWVGNFHSTKIYEFRMKCPQCIQRFVVRTDPQNCEYIYVSGAKRIFQTKDCTDDTRIRDQEAQKKIKENPFAKLQNQYRDKLAYGGIEENLQKLQQIQQRGGQDYQLNRMLRKKARFHREEQQQYFREKMEKNLFIPLLPAIQQDQQKANLIKFKINKHKAIKKEEKIVTEVDRLKQKMKKMKPEFRNILQKQIKIMNKPNSSIFIKK